MSELTGLAKIGPILDEFTTSVKEEAYIDVLSIPLRENICSCLKAFEGTGITSDHLAALLEDNVRAWLRLNLDKRTMSNETR